MIIKNFIAALLVILLPSTVFAATVNVSSVGELQSAVISATAGDIIQIRSGTYNIGSNVVCTNSGIGTGGGQRIYVRMYPGESAIINDTQGSENGPIVMKGDYWEWDLARMTINYVASFFNMNDFTGVSGVSGDYSYIHDSAGSSNIACTTAGGDNSGFVKIDAAGNHTVIENLDLSGTKGASSNASGIYSTKSNGVKVRNCVIHGYNTGMYFKHSNACNDTDTEFSYNYTYGNNRGMTCEAVRLTCHNNIFSDSVIIGDDGGNGLCGVGGDLGDYDHNTFQDVFSLQRHSDSNEWGDGCQQNNFTNNIFQDPAEFHRYAESSYSDSVNPNNTGDYNLYDSIAVLRDGNSLSLAQWRTYQGGCPGAYNDCSSIDGNPTFVGGASPFTISGFVLTSESFGYQEGSDGDDMGADVTLVGVNATGETPETSPGISRATVSRGTMQ